MEETMESPPEQQQTVTNINESADSSTNEGAFVISDVLEDLETIMEASIINKISQCARQATNCPKRESLDVYKGRIEKDQIF